MAADKWNRVRFKPVRTTAVRLMVKLRENASAGVHEFRVTGDGAGTP